MTIDERADKKYFARHYAPTKKLMELYQNRYDAYIEGANEQKEIDQKEIEELQDRLDCLHMTHISQVGLWKSRYKHALKTVDEFWREEILTSLPGGVYQSWAIHKLEELKKML